MGLNIYLGDYETNPPNEENDPQGHKAFAFEMLRELSDAAETQITGMNGDATVKLRIPQEDVLRIQREIAENVPPPRMKGFFDAIEAHSAQARGALEKMNGHASSVDKHVIGLTIRLNATLRKLLESAAAGNEPDIQNDVFDDELHGRAIAEIVNEGDEELDEWEIESEANGDQIVGRDDDELDEDEEAPPAWKASLEPHPWQENDDEDNEEGEELALTTPEPYDVDPETEALILDEASETIVDLPMIIRQYQEMLAHFKNLAKDQRPPESETYQATIIAVMQGISDRCGGKINLECLAIELSSAESIEAMEWLSDLEQIGCISDVFHNVAETVLMQVDAYSNLVDADAEGEYEANDRNAAIALTFIQRLKERYGIQ